MMSTSSSGVHNEAKSHINNQFFINQTIVKGHENLN